MDRQQKLEAVARGQRAEAWVAERLREQGWSELARNWRCDAGELDLVVERDGVLRFVEVKARAPGDEGGLEAIGESKRRHLRRAGETWLTERGLPEREVAFLVVVVTCGPGAWTAEWLDDAF
ncbi:MAG: YraN family protein [Alphaproteobacteria bacterium]|nr:YraN family protein [Alphaproteobacteria bacterium]MCB9697757.1 YraN family protein [Alphaproteobacteria bacterium]